MDPRSNKRRRVSRYMSINEHDSDCEITDVSTAATPSRDQRRASIRSISPTLGSPKSPPPFRQSERHSDNGKENVTMRPATYSDSQTPSPGRIPSPIHLSTVNGLADSTNVDTVSLRDILGDPLIKECWLFNYLIDVHFVMYTPFACLSVSSATDGGSGLNWTWIRKVLCR